MAALFGVVVIVLVLAVVVAGMLLWLSEVVAQGREEDLW